VSGAEEMAQTFSYLDSHSLGYDCAYWTYRKCCAKCSSVIVGHFGFSLPLRSRWDQRYCGILRNI